MTRWFPLISRLDRYILRQYLISIFFSMFVFVLIAVPIDYSEKTNNFLHNRYSDLTFGKIVKDYFLPFIPSMMALLANIMVFISSVFFTARLAGRSEFIAVFSSGVSLKRLLRPYLIGSSFLAFLLWWGNDTFLPKINGIKADFTQKYIDNIDPSITHYHYYAIIDSQSLIGIDKYNSAQKTGSGVLLAYYHNNIIRKIRRADEIKWSESQKNWVLYNVQERIFGHLKEKTNTRDSLHLSIFIKPEDFLADNYLKERLNNRQLQSKIRLETIKGSEQVPLLQIEYYQRSARPISIIILSLISCILASRKIRGGSGLHIAIGILIAASYVIMERFSSVLATKAHLNALLATWTPNMFYAAVAAYLYRKAPQ